MKTITSAKENMALLSQEQLAQAAFGTLCQTFALRLLERAGYEDGLYQQVALEFLEEGRESPPPVENVFNIDLSIVLKSLRREEQETRREKRAAEKLLTQALRLQEQTAARSPGKQGGTVQRFLTVQLYPTTFWRQTVYAETLLRGGSAQEGAVPGHLPPMQSGRPVRRATLLAAGRGTGQTETPLTAADVQLPVQAILAWRRSQRQGANPAVEERRTGQPPQGMGTVQASTGQPPEMLTYRTEQEGAGQTAPSADRQAAQAIDQAVNRALQRSRPEDWRSSRPTGEVAQASTGQPPEALTYRTEREGTGQTAPSADRQTAQAIDQAVNRALQRSRPEDWPSSRPTEKAARASTGQPLETLTYRTEREGAGQTAPSADRRATQAVDRTVKRAMQRSHPEDWPSSRPTGEAAQASTGRSSETLTYRTEQEGAAQTAPSADRQTAQTVDRTVNRALQRSHPEDWRSSRPTGEAAQASTGQPPETLTYRTEQEGAAQTTPSADRQTAQAVDRTANRAMQRSHPEDWRSSRPTGEVAQASTGQPPETLTYRTEPEGAGQTAPSAGRQTAQAVDRTANRAMQRSRPEGWRSSRPTGEAAPTPRQVSGRTAARPDSPEQQKNLPAPAQVSGERQEQRKNQLPQAQQDGQPRQSRRERQAAASEGTLGALRQIAATNRTGTADRQTLRAATPSQEGQAEGATPEPPAGDTTERNLVFADRNGQRFSPQRGSLGTVSAQPYRPGEQLPAAWLLLEPLELAQQEGGTARRNSRESPALSPREEQTGGPGANPEPPGAGEGPDSRRAQERTAAPEQSTLRLAGQGIATVSRDVRMAGGGSIRNVQKKAEAQSAAGDARRSQLSQPPTAALRHPQTAQAASGAVQRQQPGQRQMPELHYPQVAQPAAGDAQQSQPSQPPTTALQHPQTAQAVSGAVQRQQPGQRQTPEPHYPQVAQPAAGDVQRSQPSQPPTTALRHPQTAQPASGDVQRRQSAQTQVAELHRLQTVQSVGGTGQPFTGVLHHTQPGQTVAGDAQHHTAVQSNMGVLHHAQQGQSAASEGQRQRLPQLPPAELHHAQPGQPVADGNAPQSATGRSDSRGGLPRVNRWSPVGAARQPLTAGRTFGVSEFSAITPAGAGGEAPAAGQTIGTVGFTAMTLLSHREGRSLTNDTLADVQSGGDTPSVPTGGRRATPLSRQMPGAERQAAGKGAWPEQIELSYLPQQQTEAPSQSQPPQASGAMDSDYVRSLPAWAQRFLKEGGAEAAGSAPQMGVARPIAALSGGTAQQEQVTWTAPQATRRPAEITYKQSEGPQATTAQPGRMSDSELRRTADRVYQMIEERIRRERRRLGL